MPSGKVELWREIVDSLSDALIVLGPAIGPDRGQRCRRSPDRDFAAEPCIMSTGCFGATPGCMAWSMTCLETGQSLDDPDECWSSTAVTIAVAAEVSPLINAAGNMGGVIVLLHNLSHQRSAERALDPGDNVFKLSPAGLAHEVKNPLTGIKGAAELLAAMFPADTRARQYCGLILDGVNRIAGLVEQVLSVSSPQRLKREPINIHQVLHQALRMAGLFPDAPDGFVIEQSFDPSLPAVTGDAAALERVFLNLIRNARESLEGAPEWEASASGAIKPKIDPLAHRDGDPFPFELARQTPSILARRSQR